MSSVTLVQTIQKRTFTTIFNFLTTTNIVEDSPQNLPKVPGNEVFYQVTDVTTGYQFSFSVVGGTTPYIDLPYGSYYYINDTANGCTIDPAFTGKNVITINTDVGDSGGRTYRFNFSKFPSIQPTIFKSAGTVIAGQLKVDIIDHIMPLF